MRRSTSMWIARICLILIVIVLFSTTLTAAWFDFKFLMHAYADKIGHLLGMFLVTSGSLLAFPRARATWVFVSAIVLAGMIELAQLAGPRSADIGFFLASYAGIAISALAFYTPEVRRRMQGTPR